MDSLYIVMPAYNEADNIEDVVRQWHPIVEQLGNDSKLVIVDDGSKDTTFAKLQLLTREFSQLIPITKPNSGHGATCLFAYNYAIEQQADYIFQTDSDGQTLPEEFWKFWDKRQEYDCVIGSRQQRQDGYSRIIVTKVLKLFLWVMMRVYVDDANTPFRLMKVKLLKKYLPVIPKDFFLANALLSAIFVLKQEHYLWLPITFKNRQGGVNSINISKICKIGLKAVADFRIAKALLKTQTTSTQ